MRKCSQKFQRITAKGNWECSICKEVFRTKELLVNHRRDTHKGNLYANHNCVVYCQFCGRKSTTKEGNTLHEKFCKLNPNKIENPQKGTHLSEETKKKVSDKMKEVYKNKSRWATQLEKRKSFAEQYFDNLFPELKQNYHVLRYFLDLANPEKKLYIEIDGEQHYTDQKVVEHDKARTEELLKEGWVCVKRIRWSDYKKLSFEERSNLIKELKTLLI